MKFLAVIMAFLGYVLVYAATANGGKFATQPWMGILQDAYQNTKNPNATGGSSNSGAPSVQNRQTPTISGGRSTSPAPTTPKKSGGMLGTVGKVLEFFGGAFPGG